MSTRANIIIEKGGQVAQLYHHCDGYWEGVGEDLLKFFDDHKYQYSGPKAIASDLEAWNDEFEYEDELNLHNDIEFFYVVNILSGGDTRITCWKASVVKQLTSINDFIRGAVDGYDSYLVKYKMIPFNSESNELEKENKTNDMKNKNIYIFIVKENACFQQMFCEQCDWIQIGRNLNEYFNKHHFVCCYPSEIAKSLSNEFPEIIDEGSSRINLQKKADYIYVVNYTPYYNDVCCWDAKVLEKVDSISDFILGKYNDSDFKDYHKSSNRLFNDEMNEKTELCEDWFFDNGFVNIRDKFNSSYKYSKNNISFRLEYNKYDNSWIFKDNRNTLYGLTTPEELKSLLTLLKIEF